MTSKWIEDISANMFEDVIYKEEMIYWKDVIKHLEKSTHYYLELC